MALLIIMLFALILPGFYSGLTVVHYSVEAAEITQPVRIALVTDLHSCDWGPGEKTLIDAIDAQAPDIVLLGGDIFDSELPDDNTEAFLSGIAGRYPCYYVTGNHEHARSPDGFQSILSILRRYRIPRLNSIGTTLYIHNQRIALCGVDDPAAHPLKKREQAYQAQVEAVRETAKGDYAVLLAHRPEYVDLYSACGFDLALCGHTHGGLWRIPLLVNGLFAPNQGWFPKYAGGQYMVGDTTMIVSRGLARESTRVPRFYNRPELVIVDIT